VSLTTERLVLRRWRTADRQPFAALNADARVMEYFPRVLSQQESDDFASRIDEHFDRHGFGLWALEVPGVVDFAGFVGLSIPRFVAPFTVPQNLRSRRVMEKIGMTHDPAGDFDHPTVGTRHVLYRLGRESGMTRDR
jgi:RimJ/RimL family protein N-acetyltransferase